MKLTSQEKQTIQAYDDNAAAWATSRNKRDDWLKQKETFKKYLTAGKILEIGSGGGRDAKDLTKMGYEYIGTDISKGLLEEAKKNNPDTKFLLQSVYELDFPKEYFDGFWACAVLLHMPKARMTEALKNIHRIIKKGGIGFITLKKGEGERFVEGDHLEKLSYKRFFSFWKLEEFTKILEENNYEILESYEIEYSNKPWLVFFVKVI